jgi:UDP-glucose 4-epimerase
MNVGSGKSYSVNELVSLLGGPVTYIPKRPGEPDQTFADIALIKRRLGWAAETPLEDGVSTMLDEIDAWKSAPVWTPDLIREATGDWFKYLGAAG